MISDSDKEVKVGQVIYVFASTGIAKSFEACLHISPLSSCKADWPPIDTYPPTTIDARLD